MKKPVIERFFLNKVKLISGNGGIEANFETEDVVGSEIYHDSGHEKSTKIPHPDLLKIFEQLKPMVARIYHFTFIREIIMAEDFKAKPEQARIAERALQEILGKINVIGISLSGSDDKAGVILTASFTADNNMKMAINTHRIKFTDTKYGFEEDLGELIKKLKEEVYNYIFEGKKAQLEIFTSQQMGGEPEEEDDDMPI